MGKIEPGQGQPPKDHEPTRDARIAALQDEIAALRSELEASEAKRRDLEIRLGQSGQGTNGMARLLGLGLATTRRMVSTPVHWLRGRTGNR